MTFVQPSSGALPTWPAIRYEFISEVRPIAICGHGDEDTEDIRVQLDVVDKTFVAMRALRNEVIAAMRSYPKPATFQDGAAGYDAETKTYRARIDYLIHQSSGSGSP
jgi:hypothetical protein